jgi:hypothetical protein
LPEGNPDGSIILTESSPDEKGTHEQGQTMLLPDNTPREIDGRRIVYLQAINDLYAPPEYNPIWKMVIRLDDSFRVSSVSSIGDDKKDESPSFKAMLDDASGTLGINIVDDNQMLSVEIDKIIKSAIESGQYEGSLWGKMISYGRNL